MFKGVLEPYWDPLIEGILFVIAGVVALVLIVTFLIPFIVTVILTLPITITLYLFGQTEFIGIIWMAGTLIGIVFMSAQ